jgi:hypothetical protein
MGVTNDTGFRFHLPVRERRSVLARRRIAIVDFAYMHADNP